jgi:Lon protease-like protein
MVRELPIFPLPIVLFPGAPQPLHIFEPRYRQLLRDCLAGDRRFGVAYAAPDPPPGTPAPGPGDVGCVALFRSTEPLPDGRSHVLTVGERRFVLRHWIASAHPYQVAAVEEFDDDPIDPAETASLAGDVRDGFARLARALGVLTERDDEAFELPADPQLLSFQVAAALEIEAAAKRALQAIRSTSARLRRLATALGPLAADAERRAAVRQRAKGNGCGDRHPQIERTT